jgi:hypothetical protein
MSGKTINCGKVEFISDVDKDFFKEWTKELKPIAEVEEKTGKVIFHFYDKTMSEDELKDLQGFFRRYEIDDTKLIVFKDKENAKWFWNDYIYDIFGLRTLAKSSDESKKFTKIFSGIEFFYEQDQSLFEEALQGISAVARCGYKGEPFALAFCRPLLHAENIEKIICLFRRYGLDLSDFYQELNDEQKACADTWMTGITKIDYSCLSYDNEDEDDEDEEETVG